MSYSNGPKIITDGLILYWDMANPKSYTNGSSTVYDISGNSRHGTASNITYSSNFKGVISTSGTSTSNITLSNSSLSLISSNHTVICATRYIGQVSNSRILTAYNNWLLGHWSSGSTRYYAGAFINSTNTFDLNWRIYAGTGDIANDIWNFYINGILLDSNNLGSYGPDGIKIGGYISSENSDGQFSFLQIYNRVLTSSEILQNYNALKGRFNL
jgi:hypothetical protein